MGKIKKEFNLKIISLAICVVFLTSMVYSHPDTAGSLRPPMGRNYPQIEVKLHDEPAPGIIQMEQKKYFKSLVAKGDYASAQEVQEHIEKIGLRYLNLKEGWSAAEDLAYALIGNRDNKTIGLRPFLNILTLFIENIVKHLHGEKLREEKARDALDAIIWAFVEVGDKSDLQWMTKLLEKLIGEIKYTEVESVITGISEAIAKYGEAEDVGHYLDIFLKLGIENLKEVEYVIYQMAFNIGTHGKSDHLAALLDAGRVKKLNDFISEAHSRKEYGYFDVLPAIGLAFLAKGNSAEFTSRYLSPLEDKTIDYVTQRIASGIIENELFIGCIKPYLVEFVPSLGRSRHKRMLAIANLAATIAHSHHKGSAKHVNEYLSACALQTKGYTKRASRVIFIILMSDNHRLEMLEAFLGHKTVKSLKARHLINAIEIIKGEAERLREIKQRYRRLNVQGNSRHDL